MAVMGLEAGNITSTFGPALGVFLKWAWYTFMGVLFMGGLWYIITLIQFNIKINVREISKGGRVICYTTRARQFKDSSNNIPQLKFFGKLGFAGEVINLPPSECLVPFASRGGPFGTPKMYDFVKKDGIYYPIQNLVLGTLQEYRPDGSDKVEYVYSVEGSGIELTRDYDSEQAILNKMKQVIMDYQNKKDTALYVMYSLAIILAIGSFLVMIIGWFKYGSGMMSLADALSGLKEPIAEATQPIITNRIGPG